VVLHAITVEHGDTAVVAVDWARDRDGALRKEKPLALIERNIQVVGDHSELLSGHIEHRPGVNAHMILLTWSTGSAGRRYRC